MFQNMAEPRPLVAHQGARPEQTAHNGVAEEKGPPRTALQRAMLLGVHTGVEVRTSMRD